MSLRYFYSKYYWRKRSAKLSVSFLSVGLFVVFCSDFSIALSFFTQSQCRSYRVFIWSFLFIKIALVSSACNDFLSAQITTLLSLSAFVFVYSLRDAAVAAAFDWLMCVTIITMQNINCELNTFLNRWLCFDKMQRVYMSNSWWHFRRKTRN